MHSESEKAGQENQQGQAPQNTGSDNSNESTVFTVTVAAAIVALSYYLSVIESDFTGFSRFLFHWLSSCGFAFDVAWVCYRAKPPKPWPIRIWSGYVVICFAMLLHNVWQIYNPNAFSFTASRTIVSGPELKIRGSNLSFWLATPSAKVPQVYPVQLLLFVRFTNHKTTTCMIDLYGVEADGGDGHWISLPSIGLKQKTLYSGNDICHANETEPGEDSFNSVIDHKNIGPEETVEGWLFLAAPEGWRGGDLRVRITETDGSVYTKYVEKVARNKAQDFSAQTASMKIHPEEKDLSSFQMIVPAFNMP